MLQQQRNKNFIRLAVEDDLSTIYEFIQQKAEFDRNMGSFAGRLGMTKEVLKESLFPTSNDTKINNKNDQADDNEAKTILSGARPYGFCLLSEMDMTSTMTTTTTKKESDQPSSSSSNKMVPTGFAMFYFRFSSFAGRPNLWMDDLFVMDQYRRLGTGRQLMNHLIKIAKENSCTHVNWTADVRNDKALNFYLNRMGGHIVSTNGNIHTIRLDL